MLLALFLLLQFLTLLNFEVIAVVQRYLYSTYKHFVVFFCVGAWLFFLWHTREEKAWLRGTREEKQTPRGLSL
jgi:uncharacterized membrane protein YqjE